MNDEILFLVDQVRFKLIKSKKIKNFYMWANKNKFLLRYWIECEICKKKRAIHIHHIDKDRNNNVSENMMLLCKPCHFKQHKRINENKSKYSR